MITYGDLWNRLWTLKKLFDLYPDLTALKCDFENLFFQLCAAVYEEKRISLIDACTVYRDDPLGEMIRELASRLLAWDQENILKYV
jgi:hypothetical protein